MKKLTLFIITFLLVAYSIGQTNMTFATWAKEKAIKIKSLELQDNQSDIEPLNRIIGNATVVCLGESRHDIHEQVALKNRLVKYLVEKMGFTTFILEASLPYSEKINEFIKNGIGNIDVIMSEMPGWFLWDTREMKEIIIWMRKYNQNKTGDEQIRFFGIDITSPVYGLTRVINYLKKVDPVYYQKIKKHDFAETELDDNFWPKSLRAYSGFSEERKRRLKNNYGNLLKTLEDNKEKYIKTTSEKEYETILRYAYCAEQANRMFSAKKRIDIGLIRDRAMANNTLWIVNKMAKGKKAIVWAHNVHVAKAEFKMTGETESIKGMGYLLYQKLKNKIISIGGTFYEGEYPNWNRSFPPANKNTLEAKLAETGYDYFVLDIRNTSKNSNVTKILDRPQLIRGQDFEMTTVPDKSFDALFFTKKITRVMPCKESLEKYRNMN